MTPPFTVLHIPHASTRVPAEVRWTLLLDDRALAAELLRMTDAYTDELFRVAPELATAVVYPVSRLVVDPERFRDDAREPMAARGMGTIYMRTSQGQPLRADLGPEARERLLRDWYDPHHAELTRLVQAALDAHARCLIIDCHSYPSVPLPSDLDTSVPRPALCIGTDAFHTPPALQEVALGLCQAHGSSVRLNRPYAGTIVPTRWFGRDARVASIMVEVNRSLYMDERTGAKLGGFEAVAELCREMCRVLIRRCQG